MKKLILAVLILVASAQAQILQAVFAGGVGVPPPAANTWTLVNHGYTTGAGVEFACSPCTQSFGFTASAGHVLVAIVFENSTNYILQTGLSSGWVHNGGDSPGLMTDSNQEIDGVYKLVTDGGENSLTWTFANGFAFHSLMWVGEFAPSNPAIFDTAGANYISSFTTTPSGIALTLTGSSDLIIQASNGGNNPCVSLDSGYSAIDVNSAARFTAVGWKLNAVSGAAPTWNCGNNVWSLNAIALK